MRLMALSLISPDFRVNVYSQNGLLTLLAFVLLRQQDPAAWELGTACRCECETTKRPSGLWLVTGPTASPRKSTTRPR